MKKKVKSLTLVVVILLILVVALGAALFMNRSKLTKTLEENNAFQQEMAQNQKTVYVAKTDIRHGDVLKIGDDGNVMESNVYTGLPLNVYITADDIGTTAIIDIPVGQTIFKTMVTSVDVENDTRIQELQVVRLMQDQQEGDYVDIRIMFPNGKDMLVLPKKQIKNLDLENCVFNTYLNEEEILRMASATIDAYTVTGTVIYANRYVETNLQESAEPTYLVNTAVQEMFDPLSPYYDKNLLTKAIQTLNYNARLDMEGKLRNLTTEKLAAVAAGHALEDTAKNSALTGDGEYDAQAAQEKAEIGATTMSGEDVYGVSTPETEETVSEEENTDENGTGELKDMTGTQLPADAAGN